MKLFEGILFENDVYGISSSLNKFLFEGSIKSCCTRRFLKTANLMRLICLNKYTLISMV